MSLIKNQYYFLAIEDAVLRINPTEKTSKNAINHLILGDAVRYLGEKNGEWSRFFCRKTEGWLKTEWVTDQRLLEVNFVDIGQGDGCHIVTPDDEIILIDAGEGIGFDGSGADNMYRFLSWRYNLRNRKVAGVDGITANDSDALPPMTIDHVVISHPDLDHYYGFLNLFKHPKLNFKSIGHNGIVERSRKNASASSWLYDLGKKVKVTETKKTYLWDTVRTHQEMVDILTDQKNSRKFYLKTLQAAFENNKQIKFHFLNASKGYFDKYKANQPLSMEILAPITESVEYQGDVKECLIKLDNESKTKNGHSVVFQLRYGKLKMMLGGDLNSESQDYLASHYSNIPTKLSDLEKDIRKIHEQLANQIELTLSKKQELEQDLDEKQKLQQLIISKTNRIFGTDIAKACHHGSSDILDSFLHAIHPLATIISSGDNESYSHPRPDALGAFGKSSRGTRPLIFSTELARSTNEFSYPIKFYGVLKALEERMNSLTKAKDKEIYRLRMEKLRDSNVARYGMITVRTDGEKVIIAQKLEKSNGNSQKWDIYSLKWNAHLQEYET